MSTRSGGRVPWRVVVVRALPEGLTAAAGAYLAYSAVLPDGPLVTTPARLLAVTVLGIMSLLAALQRWGRSNRSLLTAALRGVTVLAAAFVAYAAVQPTSGYVTESRRLAAVGALAVAGVWLVVRSSEQDVSEERLGRLRLPLQDVTRGLALAIADAAHDPAAMADLDVNVWLVEGHGQRRRLTRAHRERLSAVPPATAVRWTKGKGVIGRAWATATLVYASPARPPAERAAWERLDDDTKMGMNYKEHQAMSGKYGEVLAAPIFSRFNRVVGVLSVESSPQRDGLLAGPAARDAVGLAAGVLSSLFEWE